ncbi:MAG: 5'/3'-nucleotidase SurE, partial [Gammaproteobacteria bacterium]
MFRPGHLLTVCLLLFAAGAAADATARSLSILLTNDDGWDSAGVKAVAAALEAAGHRVTVVAPLGQRSGSGMKITLGEFDVVEQRPGVWSVDASPADAVSWALRDLLGDAGRPDLVVSGANFGQNMGSNVFSSGTVGAAMVAVLEGIPAIAVSVGIRLDEFAAEPVRFPSTLAAFPQAAALTAKLVDALAAREAALLPPGTLLNVNVPALAPAAVKGVRWTRAGAYGGFVMSYPSREGDTVKSWIAVDERGLGDAHTDTA